MALGLVAPVVLGGPAAAETTVEVEAGYGGWFLPGREVPVRVRVSADRLVRGTLEVAVGTAENGVPVAMAVEVPGGGEKEFLLTASSGLNQSPEVTARVHQGGDLIASGETTARAAGDTELVGVLPAAVRGRALPGAAPLAVDAGTARFTALGEAELALAPASLGPVSTLAADVEDLVRLSPEARAGVLRWIDEGGRLLVDSGRGQPVPGLPDAWQPGTRGRAPAGLGEVVATDGAIAAGRWSGLVEPSVRGVLTGFDGPDMSLASVLAADAGLRTPELGWLLAFLVVYVVAAGPLLFFAVRRLNRPELAWVAIPLVALVFATGSYLVGRDLRKATQLVHASVLSEGVGGPVATSYVGVFSRGGETARIGFPTGWTTGRFPDLGQLGPLPTLVTATANGPDTVLPLDAGQFGVVHGRGPVAGGGGLEVSATVEEAGRIKGTVRNPTDFQLDDVAVFVGADAVMVGVLAPGAERIFETAAGGQFGPGPGPGGAEFRMWASRGPTGPFMGNLALWQVAVQGAGANFRGPDVAVAAGFTSDFSPELRKGGSTTRPHGKTLVLGRARVAVGPDGPLEVAARRDVVRDPFAGRFRPGGAGEGSVVRFVLPEGTDGSKLVVRTGFASAEVWRDGAWQAATCQGPNCLPAGGPPCPPGVPCPMPAPPILRGGPGGGEFAVPQAAVRDGVVHVRVPGPALFEGGSAVTLSRSM